MNKREMIHALIDRLLDIEESGTKKELNFSYGSYGEFQTFNFYFYEGNGSREWVTGDRTSVHFKGFMTAPEEYFKRALVDIELIRNTPDVEPKVNVTLSIEKARELGLIA